MVSVSEDISCILRELSSFHIPPLLSPMEPGETQLAVHNIPSAREGEGILFNMLNDVSQHSTLIVQTEQPTYCTTPFSNIVQSAEQQSFIGISPTPSTSQPTIQPTPQHSTIDVQTEQSTIQPTPLPQHSTIYVHPSAQQQQQLLVISHPPSTSQSHPPVTEQPTPLPQHSTID